MKNNIYLVTDPRENLLEIIEECCKNGIFAVQLRDKECTDNEYIKQSKTIYSICKKYNVNFIINDRVHLLSEIECDGVHVGQDDEKIENFRALHPKLNIGVSCQTSEQVAIAKEQGANLIGVGSMFNTKTKKDAKHVSIEELKKMSPYKDSIVIIGGINSENIDRIPKKYFKYIAVSSYLLDSSDIKNAILKLQV